MSKFIIDRRNQSAVEQIQRQHRRRRKCAHVDLFQFIFAGGKRIEIHIRRLVICVYLSFDKIVIILLLKRRTYCFASISYFKCSAVFFAVLRYFIIIELIIDVNIGIRVIDRIRKHFYVEVVSFFSLMP